MGSIAGGEKTHVVCVPFPAQGHVTPMLHLAKLLHSYGAYVTFVNTDFNHRRLLRTQGAAALAAVPGFRFATIPDGLPPSDEDATQDIPSLCYSSANLCLAPFRDLLHRLNDPSATGAPPVSCIVSDGVMSFTLDVSRELGIPELLFWTTSACGFMGYLHYRHLVDRGLVPLKSEADLTNGYLDTPIDWVPGMKNVRLRDLPTFLRTTDPEDLILNFALRETQRASLSAGIILNTFDELERDVLDAMRALLARPVYTVGPLAVLSEQRSSLPVAPSFGSNLWKEERSCLAWLAARAPASVVYVNFGSVAVMSKEQLVDFAWGLANSRCAFLWVVRADLVRGETAALPEEFAAATAERGMVTRWCPQEEVLGHPAVGAFLTHSGWNSTVESLSHGVPMICWPFFAEQQTNCRYACAEWGVGMEIGGGGGVGREEVERVVRELLGGERGREMRNKAQEWKESAIRATHPGGTSCANLEKLIKEFRLSNQQQ